MIEDIDKQCTDMARNMGESYNNTAKSFIELSISIDKLTTIWETWDYNNSRQTHARAVNVKFYSMPRKV